MRTSARRRLECAFGGPLKLLAVQDVGGRDQDLLDAVLVEPTENAGLVAKLVARACAELPGAQLLTDQGSPYMAQRTLEQLDALELEHAPQKEGDPIDSCGALPYLGVAMRSPSLSRQWLVLLIATSGHAGCAASHVASDDAGPRADAGTDAAVEPDASAEPCDTPGERVTEACGTCGMRVRICTSDFVWEVGGCEGDRGECIPGAVGMIACGSCGTQSARCTASCEWDPTSACSGEGECAPTTRSRTSEGCMAGETRELVCSDACTFEPAGACTGDYCPSPGATETLPCGMCGSLVRVCNRSNTWEYGPCSGEGACAPGATGTLVCGMCGTMPTRCDMSCRWVSAGACTGEGPCTLGERRTTTAGCAAGEARVLECDSMCAFTIEARPCRRTCTAPSDCPGGVCRGGFCDGAAMCRTGPARVLVYERGGTTGSGWFPSGTITTIANDSVWRSMSTADFGQFDVVFIAGGRCSGTEESVLGTALDTIGAWGPAIRGRIVVAVDDADLHGGVAAELFHRNLIDWLKTHGRNQDAGRTSLYMSWGCTMASSYTPGARATPETFAAVLGTGITGGGTNYCMSVAVTAAGMSHPVTAGIPPFWGCPFHGGFGSVPAGYMSLVDGTTGPNEPTMIARDSPMPCIP